MTESPTIIFCDGACSGNPGPGGWGSIVATPDGRVIELGGAERPSTNNRMELTAAIEALIASAAVPGNVVVYTDSVYVIKGITQWIWGWRNKGWKTSTGGDVANRELWEKLSVVVGRRPKPGKIEWKYVRGHSGVPGNERVDEIAVAYAKNAAIHLFRGARDTYRVDLITVETEAIVDKKRGEKTEKKVAYSYVSAVDGVVERHASWAECEQRVKGRPRAKFKKAMTAAEEADLIKRWK